MSLARLWFHLSSFIGHYLNPLTIPPPKEIRRSQPVQGPHQEAEAVETAAESEELAPQYDVMTSQDIPSGERETLKLDETLSLNQSQRFQTGFMSQLRLRQPQRKKE